MAKRYNPLEIRRRPGAPTLYTPELAAEVCRRISRGRSLISVCEDADMPSHDAVYDWMHAHPEFGDEYTRAKMHSAEADADQAMRIREAVAQGRMDPNAGRVAIDEIKWSSAHKQPKRFGVQRHEHGGKDGGAIPVRFESLSDAQLDQFIERLRSSATDAGAGAGGAGAPPEGEDL